MDDQHEKKNAQKPPRDGVFLLAMLFYLLLVHGTSLFLSPAGLVQGDSQQYPTSVPWLSEGLDAIAGGSALRCALIALPILYGCMVCVFLLTRMIVGGPPWLGSLAGSFLMAHPAKSEVLYSPTGLFYSLAALFALLSILFYTRHRLHGSAGSLGLAYLTFAFATFPFVVNTVLVGVIILVEAMVGDAEKRNWLRPLPLVFVAMAANWIQIETVYAVIPTPDRMFVPLLLIIYPIGLLPETLAGLQATPWLAWLWGGVVALIVLAALRFVKNNAFRFAVLAVVVYRVYHGALPFDMVTMEGGGQLFVPIALAGLALGAFSAWLMQFKEWGQPTVALTTVTCVILFVLQFGANIAYVNEMRRIAVPEVASGVPAGPTVSTGINEDSL